MSQLQLFQLIILIIQAVCIAVACYGYSKDKK